MSHPPRGLDELEILPGVEAAARRLSALGLRLIVVTNQPDVARGTQTCATVEAINDVLRTRLILDDVVTCFHDGSDDCACASRGGDVARRGGAARGRPRGELHGGRPLERRRRRPRRGLPDDSRGRLGLRPFTRAPDFHAADLAGTAEFIAGALARRSRIRRRSVRFVEQ